MIIQGSSADMCKENFSTTIYRGGGCTRACDRVEINQDPCDQRPPLIRTCPNYKRIDAASVTKRTARPGHKHNEKDDEKKGGSGGGGDLGGATEGGGAIAA